MNKEDELKSDWEEYEKNLKNGQFDCDHKWNVWHFDGFFERLEDGTSGIEYIHCPKCGAKAQRRYNGGVI